MKQARGWGVVLVCLAGSAAAQDVTSRTNVDRTPCSARDVVKNEDAARILAASPGLSNRTPRGDASTNSQPVGPGATSSVDSSSPTTGPFGELSLSPSPPQPVIRTRTRVPRPSTPKKR